MKGQVTNRTQERMDLWEGWAASPVDALRICTENLEERAEGSSTYCSLKDQEGGPPYMHDTPVTLSDAVSGMRLDISTSSSRKLGEVREEGVLTLAQPVV